MFPLLHEKGIQRISKASLPHKPQKLSGLDKFITKRSNTNLSTNKTKQISTIMPSLLSNLLHGKKSSAKSSDSDTSSKSNRDSISSTSTGFSKHSDTKKTKKVEVDQKAMKGTSPPDWSSLKSNWAPLMGGGSRLQEFDEHCWLGYKEKSYSLLGVVEALIFGLCLRA